MSLVDWDFAVTVGSTAVRPRAGGVTPTRRPRPWSSCARGPTGPPRWSASSPACAPTAGTAPVLVVDRAGWIQANADGFAKILTPIVDKITEKKGPPTGLSARRRLPGHRRRGRADARLPRLQGARPVRPVPRPARPAAARGAQHRPRRARDRRRPARLPAVGVPPRGDAPGAVHRQPVARRAPAGADERASPTRSSPPRCSRACAAAPSRSAAAAAACSTWSPRRSRRRSSTGSPA